MHSVKKWFLLLTQFLFGVTIWPFLFLRWDLKGLSERENLDSKGISIRRPISRDGPSGIQDGGELMRALANLIFVAAILYGCLAAAQSAESAPAAHQHTQPNVIDGAVHPEMIPDSTAYRLYLVMVSRPVSPTDPQKKRREAQLGKIGLQDADRKALDVILGNFHSEYQNLIQTFNQKATAAWARGERPDTESLRLQRDQLVQSTHDALNATLTAKGKEILDTHVQNEKKHMKIPAKEGVQ
jgi:hypothetical protein